MILEAIFNGEIYPAETVVRNQRSFGKLDRQSQTPCDTLSRH